MIGLPLVFAGFSVGKRREVALTRSPAFPDRASGGAEFDGTVQWAWPQISDVDAGGHEGQQGARGGLPSLHRRLMEAAAAVWQSRTVAMMPPLRKPNPLSCSGHGMKVAVTYPSAR